MTTATFTKSQIILGPAHLVANTLRVSTRREWRRRYNVESDEAKAHFHRFQDRQWQPIRRGSRQERRLTGISHNLGITPDTLPDDELQDRFWINPLNHTNPPHA